MKTMQQWFDEYSVSHQNEINQKIHFICVPTIYFSIDEYQYYFFAKNNWIK